MLLKGPVSISTKQMRTYVCDEMSFTRFSLGASCSFTHRSSLGGELRASPGAVAASPLLRGEAQLYNSYTPPLLASFKAPAASAADVQAAPALDGSIGR